MATSVSGVVFGHMHEDHTTELLLVARMPLRRAVVIASGGDLAFAMAAMQVEVIAVDSNPAQIELVKLKMEYAGDLTDLCFCGRVDRLLRLAGPVLSWLMDVPQLQPGSIRCFLINMGERILRGLVSRVHGSLAAAKLDQHTIRLIRCRFEKAMRDPAAARNPLLQVLLGRRFGGETPAVWSRQGILNWKKETHRIYLQAGDLATVLGDLPEASVGLISVSNLPDAMSQAAWDSVVEKASQVLAVGGYLVVRSMLCEAVYSVSDSYFLEETHLSADASPLCPVIWVGKRKSRDSSS
jgi:S-adenosylmethionine:diacylglycerol 3-amino-3-carboxypropyl transferase